MIAVTALHHTLLSTALHTIHNNFQNNVTLTVIGVKNTIQFYTFYETCFCGFDVVFWRQHLVLMLSHS